MRRLGLLFVGLLITGSALGISVVRAVEPPPPNAAAVAAHVGDGALSADVLHSERTSDGDGGSRLARVQDADVGTNDQLGDACVADVPGVINLACLVARGGDNGAGDSSVASAAAADGSAGPVV